MRKCPPIKKMDITPPPAPRKRRVRCPFDDPDDHICVKYIETKVYDSGHVEHITCQRIFRRCEDVVDDEDILYSATQYSYLGANALRALDVHGHAISVYDRRIRQYKEERPDIKFHQLILIKIKK